MSQQSPLFAPTPVLTPCYNRGIPTMEEDLRALISTLEARINALEVEVRDLKQNKQNKQKVEANPEKPEKSEKKQAKPVKPKDPAMSDDEIKAMDIQAISEETLKSLPVSVLKKLCKFNALKGYSKLAKEELVQLIAPQPIRRFEVPREQYEWGFSMRICPEGFSSATVLTHKAPLRVEMNYDHDGFVEFNESNPRILKLSDNVFLERKDEWDDDTISREEVEKLRTMTREQAMEWFDTHPTFGYESADFESVLENKTVQTVLNQLADEAIRDNASEQVYATSTNGEYGFDDLANIIYYTFHSFKGFNVHELVYAIECNTKTNELTYDCNT
jgi:hypothetical protein